jgi:hypothetical protein
MSVAGFRCRGFRPLISVNGQREGGVWAVSTEYILVEEVDVLDASE